MWGGGGSGYLGSLRRFGLSPAVEPDSDISELQQQAARPQQLSAILVSGPEGRGVRNNMFPVVTMFHSIDKYDGFDNILSVSQPTLWVPKG